ncbi:hypothetical protein BH10ACT1_BH10ACT1_30790 [soil metagenome]
MHKHPKYRGGGRDDERGAGLVEYALLLALIAAVTFSAVAFFGGANAGGFGKSQSCMTAAYGGQAMPANCSGH